MDQSQLEESKLPDYPKATFSGTEPGVVNVSEKLERTLASIAPFLRDIFIEFSQVLTKTLVGSHGQELIPSGLQALRQTASVVELVMLLCSQEWQNSLQVLFLLVAVSTPESTLSRNTLVWRSSNWSTKAGYSLTAAGITSSK